MMMKTEKKSKQITGNTFKIRDATRNRKQCQVSIKPAAQLPPHPGKLVARAILSAIELKFSTHDKFSS